MGVAEKAGFPGRSASARLLMAEKPYEHIRAGNAGQSARDLRPGPLGETVQSKLSGYVSTIAGLGRMLKLDHEETS